MRIQSFCMHTCGFERVKKAILLPAEWNTEAPLYFQRKEFLHHADLLNPCNQRYYLLWKQNQLIAGACVYTLGIPLFTFSGIPGKINMQVIGLPASVSAPGIFGRSETAVEKLIQYILKEEKGFILGLNLPLNINVSPAIEMTMMPTVSMQLHFDSWEDYLSSLRSHYRRRANRITKAFSAVTKKKTGCNEFTPLHYNLYLQIMKRTKNKLETLSYEFFKQLPADFYLTSYYANEQLLCWHINCIDQHDLIFFFGGHDYKLLNQHHSYFNNLFGIISEAIDNKFTHIDLGQTAEIAKMKAGGTMDKKMMFLYHKNKFTRKLLQLFKPMITYHPPEQMVHPMKTAATFIQHQT